MSICHDDPPCRGNPAPHAPKIRPKMPCSRRPTWLSTMNRLWRHCWTTSGLQWQAPLSAVPAQVDINLSSRFVVRPRKGWQPLELKELWSQRELLWVLASRDIKIRYKQTVLGIAWAVIQPLFTMVVFTTLARFGNIPTDGVPAPIFYYCGMLPWFLFANAVGNAANSLVGSQHLMTKVYFPRLIVPIASA